LPGQKPVGFYVCTGLPPQASQGVPASLYGIEIPTVLLQAFVMLRITFYRRRTRSAVTTAAAARPTNDVDKKSIMSSASNLLLTCLILTMFSISFVGSSLPPEKLILFPYSIFLYFSALILPLILTFIFVLGLYFKNPEMRVCVSREVKALLDEWFFWQPGSACASNKK